MSERYLYWVRLSLGSAYHNYYFKTYFELFELLDDSPPGCQILGVYSSAGGKWHDFPCDAYLQKGLCCK